MLDIEGSLTRLNTDFIDVYQLYGIKNDWEVSRVLQNDGALRAIERLRDEGVVRNIGITGHKDPAVLTRAIKQYPFDTALLTLNAADVWHRPVQEELLWTAHSQGIGVVAMKVFAKYGLISPGRLTAEQAMQYVYSFPVSTSIIGVNSLSHLEEDVAIAGAFSGPLSPAELQDLENATETYQADGNWFKAD